MNTHLETCANSASLLFISIHRIVTYLSRTRTRIPYHWGELWRALLSVLRLFISHATEMAILPGINAPLDGLVQILAFVITAGETFLPDSTSYDDLLYKLLGEAVPLSPADQDMFTMLRAHFSLAARPQVNAAVELMAKLTSYYRGILERKRGRRMSPKEVGKVIKEGYEGLEAELQGRGPEGWEWGRSEPFREAERRALLKRAARETVRDVKIALAKQG